MHLKTFSNLYTFLAVYLAHYVMSQVDINDGHFLPFDVANSSRYIITSVLFLWGSNLNKIVIDAGLDLVLQSYPQHTPLLKRQSLVCITEQCLGSQAIVFVAKICRIIEWNARNSGQNLCRSTCTTRVLISLGKWKLTLKHSKHCLCMYVRSRFIIIV